MKFKFSQVLEGMRSDKAIIGQVQSFPSLLSLITAAIFLIDLSVKDVDILVLFGLDGFQTQVNTLESFFFTMHRGILPDSTLKLLC